MCIVAIATNLHLCNITLAVRFSLHNTVDLLDAQTSSNYIDVLVQTRLYSMPMQLNIQWKKRRLLISLLPGYTSTVNVNKCPVYIELVVIDSHHTFLMWRYNVHYPQNSSTVAIK